MPFKAYAFITHVPHINHMHAVKTHRQMHTHTTQAVGCFCIDREGVMMGYTMGNSRHGSGMMAVHRQCIVISGP
jgi:hypothetical protein